jgi:hypothetical protein
MNTLRVAFVLLILALTGWVLVAVFAPAGEPTAPQSFTSSTECQACHETVYAEWQDSWHARSWDDPDVRSLSQDFANTDCIDCHAPRPIFSTGIGKRVLPRSSRRSEGVDCIACHVLPEGGVAGTIDDPTAPCRPTTRRELAREEFCAVCHDQHETVKEWSTSRYAEEGLGCIECHMPFRNGDPNQGRDHRCLGGHDEALVRSAVELRAAREEGRWIVVVENVGAGHSFPTDERSRAADLFWRPLAAAGEAPGPWRHAHRFRSPYRYEVDVQDTLLLVHEARRIPLEDGAARGAVEVALFYKLTPYYEDPERPDPEREARLVHRLELRP